VAQASPGARTAGGKAATYLIPAPKGDFILMLMYWPKEKASSILPPGDGSWSPPPAKRV